MTDVNGFSVLKNVNCHTAGRFYTVVKTCRRELCQTNKAKGLTLLFQLKIRYAVESDVEGVMYLRY